MYNMEDGVLSENKLNSLLNYLDITTAGRQLLFDVSQKIIFRET